MISVGADNTVDNQTIIGSLLGTAIGDAIGLPYEGLSRQRALKLLGAPDRHRFCFGRGMVSDDTEHACMVAQSLIASGADLERFRRQLAWRLRFWLLGLPAGVGLATARALLRLWVGVNPVRSGVFSAGNGPAMRAPILGAAVADRDRLRACITVSTRMTHTDPKAEQGALVVALAARIASEQDLVSPADFMQEMRALPGDAGELMTLLEGVVESVSHGQSTLAYAETRGFTKGVSGYVFDSVPIVIHAWLSHPRDFRSAIMAVIACGGDTDTTGAMVGGIIGAAVGRDGLPSEWMEGLCEWPRSVAWMQKLATRLAASVAADVPARPLYLSVPGILLRNLFFLVIVLYHGLRRIFPPY